MADRITLQDARRELEGKIATLRSDLRDRLNKSDKGIDARINEMERFLDQRSSKREKMLHDEIEDLRKELNNFVTYKSFMWVIGILMTILMAVLAFLTNGIAELGKIVDEIRISQSRDSVYREALVSDVSDIKEVISRFEIVK